MNPGTARETFETAMEHACRDVPVVEPGQTAAQIREALRGKRYESATHVIVCREGIFAGVMRIEDVLAADDSTTAEELMDTDAPRVAPGVDQEVAAWQAVRHGESALAVVDEAGRFVGLIPPDRMLAILLSEHEEDLARLAGLSGASSARLSSEEPIARRFAHRLPWLLIGLGGALAAADIVGFYEEALRRNVMLSFFMASVVYLADAVGTQTETVVVRGLSLGVPIRRVLARELLTGLLMGCVLGLIALPLIYARWGDANVAVGVSLSLAAACSTATVAAMLLPWLFDRFGVDPAFGSGPLATVIQDLLSILIYFAIVTMLIR
jgi:magnesium transporter